MKLKQFLNVHGSTILTTVSCLGVVACGYLGRSTMIKAERILEAYADEQYNHGLKDIESCYPRDFKTRAKLTWHCYIPLVAVEAATISSIIFAHKIDTKRIAMLGGAAVASSALLEKLNMSVKDTLGEDSYQKVKKSIAQKNYIHDLPVEGCGDTLFYDDFGERYFRSSITAVMAAENALNRDLQTKGVAYLETFYNMLGLDPRDTIGFGWKSIDIPWIDYDHIVIDEDEAPGLTEKSYILIPVQVPSPIY